MVHRHINWDADTIIIKENALVGALSIIAKTLLIVRLQL